MGNRLYVGNLPYSVRDADLQAAFSAFGSVTSARVMMERETGRSKGFGFVEMADDAQAQAAINGLHGKDFGGRAAVVNEARPAEPRAPREGYGGRGAFGAGVPRGPYGVDRSGDAGDGRLRSPYGGAERRGGGYGSGDRRGGGGERRGGYGGDRGADRSWGDD